MVSGGIVSAPSTNIMYIVLFKYEDITAGNAISYLSEVRLPLVSFAANDQQICYIN